MFLLDTAALVEKKTIAIPLENTPNQINLHELNDDTTESISRWIKSNHLGSNDVKPNHLLPRQIEVAKQEESSTKKNSESRLSIKSNVIEKPGKVSSVLNNIDYIQFAHKKSDRGIKDLCRLNGIMVTEDLDRDLQKPGYEAFKMDARSKNSE